MSELQDKSISIRDAVINIRNGKYLMPAFQRSFVWDMRRIEKLWDSILQGYPISTFLFWHVDSENVTPGTEFCGFMRDVRFDFAGKADKILYGLCPINFGITDTAVLDGQQRLTSLYLTLLGDIGMRAKHQSTKNMNRSISKLMIELNQSRIETQEDFDVKKFDISFTKKDNLNATTRFEIKRIFDKKFEDKNTRDIAIEEIVTRIPMESKQYARDTLNLLCSKVFDEKLIRYTEIVGMNQDDALEMFVRFNSGGMNLKKSDITMAIFENYWAAAKMNFGNLLKGSYSGFDTEFIIRTAHMLYGDVVKSNITRQVAANLKNNWDCVVKAFENTAQILNELNIDVSRFRNSWNILVPIIFFVYYQPHYVEYMDGISAYIHRAILFGYFKSGTTGKLQTLKKQIQDNGYQLTVEIIDDIYDLRASDAKIEELLTYEKDSRMAGEILYYISKDWLNTDFEYHQDHLHPHNFFMGFKPYGITQEKWVEWVRVHNRIPNLHYLYWRGNESKGEIPLKDYYDSMSEDAQKEFVKNSFIPEGISLDLINFDEFYEKRKQLLISKIKELVKWSGETI